MMIVFWPYSESEVVRDLTAPECKMWRELPSGYTAGEYPNVDAPCYAILSFLFMKAASVRSVQDYQRFVKSERVRITVIWLLVWLIAIALLYAIGFSFGWVRQGFRAG
jgi:predicted membrane protein